MNREEFKKFIESIGFKDLKNGNYVYKEYIISLFVKRYEIYISPGWSLYDYNDLKPLEKEFKSELRSIKLKQLLR